MALSNDDLQAIAQLLDMKLESALKPLKDDISGLKDDVSTLKDDVSGLKDDVKDLKREVKKLHKNDDLILDEIERVHDILNEHVADTKKHTA